MEKDFGIRFTDELYATREDIKKALNISSIDSIWDKVSQFRAYYTRQVDLKNIERVPFSIVLPPKISSKIVSLEKKLTKLLIKFSLGIAQNQEDYSILKNEAYFQILNCLSESYQINIKPDTLNAIIFQSIPTLPIEYLIVDRYYRCLKYIETRNSGNFSELVILSLYAKLRGIELDVNNLDSYYRKSELIDRNDHVFVGKHYDAAPVERVKDLVISLCDFLNDSPLFSVVKASIAYFFINYIKPFEYYNEEMALLIFKYVLAKEDFDSIPSMILIEDLLSKEFENELNRLSFESEIRLDLTYIVNFLITHLAKSVSNIENYFDKLDKSMVYEENFVTENKKIIPEPVVKSDYDLHENGNIEVEGVTFKQNVSLPTMPIGLDEKDANLVAMNLIEIYPSMKKGQAQFYSRHCTVGKYYTISQYKKEQNVAYETARTSMDNLANLGLYKKEQIKNKFVYTPVVKK